MLWMLQILGGSIVCVLVWRLTRSVRPIVAKAVIRATPMALTLAPDAIVGHGVLFPPGVTLFIYALISGERFVTAGLTLYSFFLLWAIVFVGLFLKYLFDSGYRFRAKTQRT